MTFPLVSSPSTLSCPFPYFLCQASRQMTGTKRETLVDVREVGDASDAHPKHHSSTVPKPPSPT